MDFGFGSLQRLDRNYQKCLAPFTLKNSENEQREKKGIFN